MSGRRAITPGARRLAGRRRDLRALPPPSIASGTGLPLKPRNDRDWADNVYREGFVAYDCGLWIGALDVIADIGRDADAQLAERAATVAMIARRSLDEALWLARPRLVCGLSQQRRLRRRPSDDRQPDPRSASARSRKGRPVPSLPPSRGVSKAATITCSPTAIGACSCTFPPYRRRSDTRAKSAFPFRYHNGGDWPYWDAVYAEELLRRKLPGWRYPLLRWWQTCLEEGWAGAVEYFSPPFGRGSLLQGWSALPAAVALRYGAEVLAGDKKAPAEGQPGKGRDTMSRDECRMKELARQALADLGAVFTALPDGAAEPLIAAILAARRVALYGAGREGLAVKGFAMRLFHMGRDVHVVGDMTTPPVGPGDLLIVSSGPGELATAEVLVDIARAAGATTAIITAEPDGRTSRKADIRIVIPAQTMANDRGTGLSVLPMGSLFEFAEAIFFELVILELRARTGETAETMRSRHTNLE